MRAPGRSVEALASRMACIFLAACVARPAAGADWPQWRGPNRDDVALESSGHPGGWPPVKLWERNVGKGCTSAIIVGGRLYVMGWHGGGGGRSSSGTDTLYCLEAATGREVWKQTYPCRYQGRLRTGDTSAYGGPSSTPTFDRQTGWLYTLSVDGDLRCWDAKNGGRLVWAKNLHDVSRIRQRPDAGEGRRDYGHTSAPLVHGDLLIVEAASSDGTVMAFEKRTGRRRWASEFREPGGHTSGPVLMKVGGIDCIASLALFRLVVMRADEGNEGKTGATFHWQTDFANNIPTPAVAGNLIVLTSNYNVSKTGLIEISMNGARQRWATRQHSKVCSPVVYKNRIFTVDGAAKCLDLATGETRWRGGNFGHGSCLVTSDDKVIVWGNGKLALVEALPTDDEYRELSRVERVCRGTCYPHVCLSDGLICCKDRDGHMVVLSVRAGDRGAVARTYEPTAPKPSPKPAPARVPRLGSETDKLHDAPAPKITGAWPGNRDGLVFIWQRAGSANQVTDPKGKVVLDCRVRPRGKAKMIAGGRMDLAGGAMLAEGADEALLNACRQGHQLSVEATIRPADIRQGGPARIISFSTDPYHRNFTIGQERDHLVLRLRTPRTGENGMRPESALCRLEAGRSHHVIVSYSPGRLTCYLNAQRVLDTDRVQGDFSNWSAQHLLFGDEWRDSRDWAGTLEGIAIHSRVIGAREAAERHKLSLPNAGR